MRIHYALFWLISKKMSVILFRSFVRLFVLSSTCLIVRTKRIVELMNVLCCYYLLACAFTDLLFLCLGRGYKLGLKKEDQINTEYHVTYVTVDCNSLLELIKT